MKSDKRWIKISVDPSEPTHIFKPWNIAEGLEKTLDSLYLLQARPKIKGDKEQWRLMKDMVYQLIRKDADIFNIHGQYLGLAAAYTPEIFSALYPRITDKFINCQFKFKDYKKLSKYQPHIEEAYKYHKVDFQLNRINILKFMLETHDKFSFLDLDFIMSLNNSKIYNIVEGINNAGADKCIAAIWHCTNRKEGDQKLEITYRPKLKKYIKEEWKILRHTKVNYWEGHPMKADIFTLERKTA